ncbi:hypothetical protein JNK13_05680 [bacterium]|nr:hypothetical protein [bacterium]
MTRRLLLASPLKLTRPRVVLMHAASYGELEGVRPVLQKLEIKLKDCDFVISTTSDTGLTKAQALTPHALILPYDFLLFQWIFLKYIQPQLILIFETELWPGLLVTARILKIPVVFVNARISDRKFESYRRFKFFFEPLLKSIGAIFVQSKDDFRKFVEIGAEQNKIQALGLTKLDSLQGAVDQSRLELRKRYALSERDFLFVAGSIRPGEYESIIAAIKTILQLNQNFYAILAPRHLDQVTTIQAELSRAEINYLRRSLGQVFSAQARVMLLDSMGELTQAYQASEVSFIGGTLVPIGGHNPFEAAQFAVPIILGRNTANIRWGVELLKQTNGVFEINSSTELVSVLTDLLLQPERRLQIGNNAQAAFLAAQGATDRVLERLGKYIS